MKEMEVVEKKKQSKFISLLENMVLNRSHYCGGSNI